MEVPAAPSPRRAACLANSEPTAFTENVVVVRHLGVSVVAPELRSQPPPLVQQLVARRALDGLLQAARRQVGRHAQQQVDVIGPHVARQNLDVIRSFAFVPWGARDAFGRALCPAFTTEISQMASPGSRFLARHHPIRTSGPPPHGYPDGEAA